MDNEKIFDLMSKIYSELQETKKEMRQGFNKVDDRFKKIDDRFKKIDDRFDGIDSRLTNVEKIVTNTEHDHGQKLQALFDAHTQNSQQLDIVDEKVDILQKSVNDLGIKTLVTDNKLIDLSRKVR